MIDLRNDVKVVTREEWGARAPRGTTRLNPSFGSTAHWEGPHMGVFSHDTCATKVRGIQKFHMDTRGWQDIAYSAVVCPHGYVFQGRWLHVRTAANGTTTGNNSAYAICYLGGQNDGYTDLGKRAMRTLMDFFDIQGAGPGRNCHRDWKSTECPGTQICTWVRAGQSIPVDVAPPPPPINEELTVAQIEELKTLIRQVTNVRRIVIGSDTARDPLGGGAIYITDGIWKRHIGTDPNVAITWYADFAESAPGGKPFVVDQKWLNEIPLAK